MGQKGGLEVTDPGFAREQEKAKKQKKKKEEGKSMLEGGRGLRDRMRKYST